MANSKKKAATPETDVIEKVAAIEEKLEAEAKAYDEKINESQAKSEETSRAAKPQKPKKRTVKKVKEAEETVKADEKPKAKKKVKATDAAAKEPKEVAKPEETTPEEKNETQKAPKARKPKKNDILTLSDSRAVETEEDQIRKDTFDLLESLQSHKMLTDIVSGVEQVGGKYVVVLFHGKIKVIIPLEKFAQNIPYSTSDYRYTSYLKSIGMNRLGLDVDYFIIGFDRENNIAIGDRLAAMAAKRKYYYNSFTREGYRRIYNGLVCEGRITSLTKNGLFVEVFGVETFIKNSEVSHQRIVNSHSEFYVGQKVNVKVLDIIRNENNEVDYIIASIKQAMANPQLKALGKYKAGNYYIGKTTVIEPYGAFVTLEPGVEALCRYADYITRPVPNEIVTIKISDIDEETGRMHGYITEKNGK